MARLAGRNGRLYMGIANATAVAEPIAFISKLSLDFKTKMLDVTAFGDTGSVYVNGLPDPGGSFDGFYDNATAQMYTAATDGIARRFYAYNDITGSQYWFGTAIFDFSTQWSVDGSVDISGSWKPASAIMKVG